MPNNAKLRSTVLVMFLSTMLLVLIATNNAHASTPGTITNTGCWQGCGPLWYESVTRNGFNYQVPIYYAQVLGGASSTVSFSFTGVQIPQDCYDEFGNLVSCADDWINGQQGGADYCTTDSGGSQSDALPCGPQIVVLWSNPFIHSYNNLQNPDIQFLDAAQNAPDCNNYGQEFPHSNGNGNNPYGWYTTGNPPGYSSSQYGRIDQTCQNFFDNGQEGNGAPPKDQHSHFSCSYTPDQTGTASCTYSVYNTTEALKPGDIGMLCEYVDFPASQGHLNNDQNNVNDPNQGIPYACVEIYATNYLGNLEPLPPNETNNGYALQIQQSPSVVYPGNVVSFSLSEYYNGQLCGASGGPGCQWLYLDMGSFSNKASPQTGYATCAGDGGSNSKNDGTYGDASVVQAQTTSSPGQGCEESNGDINGVTITSASGGPGCQLATTDGISNPPSSASYSYTVDPNTPPGNYLLCGYDSISDPRGQQSIPYWTTANFIVCAPGQQCLPSGVLPYCNSAACQGITGTACLTINPGSSQPECIPEPSGGCPTSSTECNPTPPPPPGFCNPGTTQCTPQPTCLPGITCYYGIGASTVSLAPVTAALCSVYTVINTVLFIIALVIMLIGGTLYAGSHMLPGSARGPLQGYAMGMVLGGVVAAIIATAAAPILSIVANVQIGSILAACP